MVSRSTAALLGRKALDSLAKGQVLSKVMEKPNAGQGAVRLDSELSLERGLWGDSQQRWQKALNNIVRIGVTMVTLVFRPPVRNVFIPIHVRAVTEP